MDRHHRGERQHASSQDPAGLRWSLLFVACELSDPKSADYLLRTALRPERRLPSDDPDPAGSELGMRLLAVKALHAIAREHHCVRRHLMELIVSRPEPAVLLEAIAAAEDLGLEAGDAPDA
jgi:hypothetical protein